MGDPASPLQARSRPTRLVSRRPAVVLPVGPGRTQPARRRRRLEPPPVSYTHLTLPTICSV
eukprot:7531735-Alexandrium_andersonii.AAC.1